DRIHRGAVSGYAAILGSEVSGGGGFDELIFDGATFDSTSESAYFSGFERVSGTIVGTPGNDRLDLRSLLSIYLYDNWLEISANGGDDVVTGGWERDRMFGGGGNDTLAGHFGDDQLHGGAGSDLLDGGPDHDILRGAGGADELIGSSGSDTIYGGA